ncbi:hypothetical protein IGI04_005945 [Brassica rapa subsp. trilocularis]|uniref:Uncharacterized protein n=1 Tax=Brassica rapa subsp. trilocularis TaxID=1813537 RepID=A0ABQ7NHK3_BRACM|nr:hypothetical protein IGI04_005945 [Brassica rapa subsp. trilocularis]
MAPALSRSLYTTPLTSLPLTPTRLSPLRTAFLPRAGSGLRTSVSCSWNLEKRCSRFAVKCNAAVAEKETAEEGSGEKFEYQAELDKLRFLSVTEPALLGDGGELEIRIKPDPDNGTITIT